MALVPCNVCGTLNSENADICLSCEYPTKGSRRPEIFKWAAILLFVLFTAPLINFALSHFKQKNQPKQPELSASTDNLPSLIAKKSNY